MVEIIQTACKHFSGVTIVKKKAAARCGGNNGVEEEKGALQGIFKPAKGMFYDLDL